MVDLSAPIGYEDWVHWQLPPNQWNSLAKIRLKQEKVSLIRDLVICLVLFLLFSPSKSGFLSLIAYTMPFVALLQLIRYYLTRHNYRLVDEVLDIYIGADKFYINVLIGKECYSYKKKIYRKSI